MVQFKTRDWITLAAMVLSLATKLNEEGALNSTPPSIVILVTTSRRSEKASTEVGQSRR